MSATILKSTAFDTPAATRRTSRARWAGRIPHGDRGALPSLFPIYVAALIWGGLYLRDARVRALLARSR